MVNDGKLLVLRYVINADVINNYWIDLIISTIVEISAFLSGWILQNKVHIEVPNVKIISAFNVQLQPEKTTGNWCPPVGISCYIS